MEKVEIPNTYYRELTEERKASQIHFLNYLKLKIFYWTKKCWKKWVKSFSKTDNNEILNEQSGMTKKYLVSDFAY